VRVGAVSNCPGPTMASITRPLVVVADGCSYSGTASVWCATVCEGKLLWIAAALISVAFAHLRPWRLIAWL
jgi:hypothetical protein